MHFSLFPMGLASISQHTETSGAWIQSNELEALLVKSPAPQVLDVRLVSDFDSDPSIIPAAEWKDPAKVDDWAASLSKDREVVVYCVRGLQVSRGVASRLIERGFDVRNLEGGIRAWKESGREVVPGKR